MNRLSCPEDVAQGFEAAWNAHDMWALANLFHADATFVNRFGPLVHGVAAIVGLHAPIHATIYKDSTMTNEVIDVTPIANGAAVVHFWSRLSAGAAHPAGPHTVDTLVLTVMTVREEVWLIKALENVTLVNQRTGEAILRHASPSARWLTRALYRLDAHRHFPWRDNCPAQSDPDSPTQPPDREPRARVTLYGLCAALSACDSRLPLKTRRTLRNPVPRLTTVEDTIFVVPLGTTCRLRVRPCEKARCSIRSSRRQ